MRLTIAIVVLVQALSAAAADNNREEAIALLVAASNASSVDQAVKFREFAHFAIFNSKSGNLAGNYERDYASPKQWRVAYQVGTSGQAVQVIELRSDDRIWSLKNIDFEPLQVQHIKPLLSGYGIALTESDAVKGVDRAKVNGVDARCIRIETITPGEKHQGRVCVDSQRKTLLSWSHDRDAFLYELFDYSPFAGKLLPQGFRLSLHGIKLVEGSIRWEMADKFAPAVFAVPPSATSRPACSRYEHPILMHQVPPSYPTGYGRVDGRVTVGIEVSSEGRVTKATVLQTMGGPFDNSALDAVRKWTYEPAKCDGQPMSSNMNVEVNFRTR